ncbi:MAG: hypothetical protein ACHQD8_05360 [Chitinophagales bacterium]
MDRLKLIVVSLLSIFFSGAMKAQDVTYSAYDRFDYRSDDYAVVGMTGGLLYTYRNTTDGALLDAYDDSMNKLATVLLDFFPQRIYQTRFVSYPDKIIVLYQALESNKVVQYVALLDEKGRLKNKPVEVGSTKTGIFGATKTYFSSTVSDDKKTILIYTVNDKGTEIAFDGKWLDDKLTITKRSHAVFKTDNTVEHGDVNVSNAGVMYISVFTPVGTQNNADQFWILALIPGAAKFDAKELPLDTKFAASGYIRVDNVNNRVYFGGFYADKKNGNYDGIIYAAYDIAGNTYLNKKFIPFDQDLINAAGARRRNHAFDNYAVRQLVVKNDGGFVLVSEVNYVTTRSNYTPGFGYYSFYSPYMTTMVHEYHYNDIMALSYNKDGTRVWSSFIPKEQYSQEDGGVFSSYALLNTGGTLAFLFNDFNATHSRIQLATLNSGGKSEIHSFTAEGNDYPDWLPRYGKQVAGRMLVVPCFHKKQICFAKVVF